VRESPRAKDEGGVILRAIAPGVTAPDDVSTIDDVDLSGYRDDHAQVPKRRSPRTSPAKAAVGPGKAQYRPSTPRTASPKIPDAPVVTNDIEPTSARTVVSFDRDGPGSFVTSMLEVEVLSAPHTWNTTPRGTNQPCAPLGSGTDSPV
jgi:hypothetical protein